MTMISEPDMPAIDIGNQEQREPVATEKFSKAKTIGVIVAGGALLITAVNMAAAVYLYRGMSDLRFVEARLEQLGAFEQRIAARLDTVNNGFQSRFEKLDSQLQGSFNEIDAGIARLGQTMPVAGGEAMPGAEEPSEIATSTLTQAPEALDGESEPGVIEAPAPRRRIASASPPAPSSNYQRIQQPDGKVYYRRIN
ncbi:hypothetical protein [Mesorhizobium sp. M7A.F.Ca.MR.245.00.0.0]|uniref:hypothetical protein n=1 Tax=Mesorhizobium sp. M7A.F.Ca.MR.245.00.0.0 TaxID=2496778 RepID=UPI000FC997AB|nr:hypothetical protein [Mesorhizobium sp. M7A.F.Ca.MR.245.00.0.0]RUV19288.1 hypothetical protein EOB80_19810 [Mesorhizobium sp. M7A.F.Ca.MR.245.00.0.0]RUV48078.1 hypothetical protein EOB77_25425 [Mesorhizobium sp. M7A.F.Ca.MR.228.00.0.0]